MSWCRDWNNNEDWARTCQDYTIRLNSVHYTHQLYFKTRILIMIYYFIWIWTDHRLLSFITIVDHWEWWPSLIFTINCLVTVNGQLRRLVNMTLTNQKFKPLKVFSWTHSIDWHKINGLVGVKLYYFPLFIQCGFRNSDTE